MKVIYGIGKVKKVFKNAVLAIGVFDGIHIGHQKLIKAAVKKARSLGGPAIVMTFSPHPVQVLKPDHYLPFVISLKHRLKIIERLDVMVCVVVHFTKRFSRLAAGEFVKRYLVDPIHPKEIFVGNDFRFGKDRSGTLEYFKEAGRTYGFKVHAITPVKGERAKIGSSRIRRMITGGKLTSAKKFLGRNVSLMGKVVRGDQRGKGLGFPTANIHPENAVVPPTGVYAVYIRVNNKKFKGMANVGLRPSFKKGNNSINVEVHIFDFQKNLYGREIIVEFVKNIRKERTFDSKEKFIAQLKRDEIKSRAILNLNSNLENSGVRL
jgi:riboflavin kinase/FMN adenylyltransferase